MKKIGYYLGVLLLVWTVFGCTDEKLFNSAGGDLLVTGTVDTPTRTLYAVGETAVTVSWAMDDEIGLLTEEQSDALCYKATSEGKQTDFVAVNTVLEGTDGQDVYAYYPYNGYNSDVTYPYAPLPYLFGQSYMDGLPDPNSDFMYAKGQIRNGALSLHFSHLFAYLKLNIRTELLKDAQGLLVESNEPVAYANTDAQPASFNLEDGTISAGNYYNNLWYLFQPEDLANNEIITCYIAVLPTSADNIISVNIYDNNGSANKGLIEKKAPKGGFQAGHVYDLSVNENEFDKIEQLEREALIALYKATGGDNWKDNTNWCSDKPMSEWAGISVWDGHVKNIYLPYSNMVGQLPEELGNLTALEIINFIGNQLTGEIPSSIGNLTDLRSLYLSDNNLTGNLPVTLANLNNLQYVDLCGNRLSGIIPDEILNCDWWNRLGYDNVIHQQPGYELTFPMYESSDYSKDKVVVQLQKSTVGKGINVVLMGDGFSDRQIASGLYADIMQQSLEAFFLLDPYATFRSFFNVYYVNAVSKNEGVTEFGETVFSSYFGEGTHIEGNDDKCMEYAALCSNFTDEEMNELLVVVLVNSTEHHGTSFMSGSSKYLGDYGRGSAVVYCTLNSPTEIRIGTLIHECGHGFAKLSDEYFSNDTQIPADRRDKDLNQREKWGWRKNIDFTSSPSSVFWNKFITDSRYDSEQIGVFEGGRTYRYGAYRPTEASIMRVSNPETYGFNAPCREAIYNRIHKLAYGDSWTYDYEKFVEWDLTRSRTVPTRTVPMTVEDVPTTPPVAYDRRWENGRFVYE